MKKKYIAILTLIIVFLAITVCFLYYMPDQIPIHYDISGNANRIGSKYELFFFPVIILFIGGLIMYLAHREKTHGNEKNEQILLDVGIIIIILEVVAAVFFYTKVVDPSSNSITFDIYRIVSILLGAITVLLGFMLPKSKKNAVFGLRTKWSMSSDDIWEKSQTFGGNTLKVCGIAIIIMSAIFGKIWLLLISCCLLLAAMVVCIYATFYIYRQSQEH